MARLSLPHTARLPKSVSGCLSSLLVLHIDQGSLARYGICSQHLTWEQCIHRQDNQKHRGSLCTSTLVEEEIYLATGGLQILSAQWHGRGLHDKLQMYSLSNDGSRLQNLEKTPQLYV